ncbi:endoribonuclease l-psp [Trichococcus palustris]|jgi:2-iminobutanoate/2-iminopropanoate deaminase|uniref:Endoribonuclease l-psp n=1 Tax=Trichococcus palustris TaxID=140314 RepID=A0A143Y3B2_9LACT|nr:Rid family detoxifying hydrolase [Trichococcus palustris]CZQ80465.1 endoribonuclease l-psp [Trichococcus palustris]SFK64514.1 2-iminobutanoate/2-iminopropanoate deaminase [Trichococcus palustris]
MTKFIATEKAPAAIGPYSQGTRKNGFIFASGQLPIDMATNELVTEPAAATTASLTNVLAIVEAGGGSLKSILKVNVFVKDINDFDAINEAYAAFFGEHKPARALVQVAALPKDAVIEIEAIATKK